MSHDASIAAFEKLVLRHIAHPRDLLAALSEGGFAQTQRLTFASDDSSIALCFEHPDLPYGVSLLQTADGAVSSCGLMIPEARGLKDALIGYVEAQEQVHDITEQSLQFLAFVPDEIVWTMVKGRFWTAKPKGEMGRTFSVTDAMFRLRGGTPAMALTVEQNSSLQDDLTEAGADALTGEGGKLQRCIDVFTKVGIACAPDLDAIDYAGRVMGFQGEPREGDTFALNGGKGEHSSTINVNTDTDFDFEFALSFTVDERIPAEVVRQKLHDAVGVTETTPGGLMGYEGAWGSIELRGQTYRVGAYCISQIFGNHVFLLQR